MPRRGGESDKLGNRYEGVWTVDNLLDVLAGNALSITIEPLGDDSLGVEFVKEMPTGQKVFHSAKRQTTGATWTLSQLTSGSKDSVLGQLFTKLDVHSHSEVVFVSGTTANELDEFTQQALRLKTSNIFLKFVAEAQWREKAFNNYLLPLCDGKADLAFDHLKRTEVVGITERELIRRVEQRIHADLCKADGSEMDAHAARLLMGEIVFDWFQQPLKKPALVEHLAKHGYRERALWRDKAVLDLIAARNLSYARLVEAELIQGAQIERTEAKEAYAALSGDHPKSRVTVIGAAGLGKSCAVAQILRLLEQEKIPVLAVRLDIQTQVLTSDALGKELGFPVSPAVVLSRIANGRRCVLLVDQLDALSFASGRNPHLWGAFDELLREAASVLNMRVLLACRAFDAEHDFRLRPIIADKENSIRIDLKLLDAELVKQVVLKATQKPLQLTVKQIELLRTPLHLNLYLQSDPKTNPAFQSVQDLLGHFWERKHQLVTEQLGHEPRWKEIITTLANWLSDHQTLSAPFDILDAWKKDALVMASQCLLSTDDRSCRFFHETFFDYAFARSFVADGGKICELLLRKNEDQHLFRRAQVRQIFAYQRDRDFPAYLSELHDLLSNQKIRFHIKKLALDWLRSLENPTIGEWRMLEHFNDDQKIGKFIRLVPHNSLPWFSVLLEAGTWTMWLSSMDANLVNHAIWLLSLPNVMKNASEKVAELIAPRLDGTEIWRNRFLNLISGGDFYHSREMFDLLLQRLRTGGIDNAQHYWWHSVAEMPKVRPAFALELLAAILERLSMLANNGGLAKFEKFALHAEFLHELENNSFEEFACRLLPVVMTTIQRFEFVHENGEVDDRLMVFHSLHGEHNFKDAFFGSLERSIKKLAIEKPEVFQTLVAPFEKMAHRTVAVLLLTGWAANGVRFADKAILFLLENSHRLTLGYLMWSGEGGSGHCAITRAVLKTTVPHCSTANFKKLETTILAIQPPHESKQLASRGLYKMLLLETLPKDRMNSHAMLELERLMAKFPKMDFSPPKPSRVMSIGSPISKEAADKMSDKHWLSAMLKYSPNRPRTPENWMKGGGHELASMLRVEAQSDKPRFARMALRMPESIEPFYFAAILDGITETHGELPKEILEKAQSPQPLDTDTIFAVLRRVHDLAGHPCGRAICSTIYRMDKRELPDEAYEIVSHYALNDANPAKETWQEKTSDGSSYYSGDPYSAGINSVRGGAASAIARLLFHDAERWLKLEAAVRALVADKSLAVRSVTLDCLLALMNRDRDLAVQLFLSLIEGAGGILGTHLADYFLHCAVYLHYSEIRPVLVGMLHSADEKARANAARQITVAAFHNKAAEDDLKIAFAGDEHCRIAIADVFANNLGNEPVRIVCRQQIIPFFNDESKKVRETADNCFRQLSSEQLAEERDLLFSFIESRAFDDGLDTLLWTLKESTALLPDVVCAIPEKVVAKHFAEHPNEDIKQYGKVYGLPELVVRLYEQTKNEAIKIRCLNSVDAMLELGIGNLDLELQKIDR